MTSMSEAEREAFLAVPRLGMLSTLRTDGSPVTVPVWFEWDGKALRVFAGAGSGKISRLQRDPRASLLVPNSMGERESWVAFDGEFTITTEGAFALAERLAHRYWEMTRPEYRAMVDTWRAGEAELRVLTMMPRRIRASLE